MPSSELVELHVAELGPISDARVEFGSGFNVLTGETGAGKTLLVGALSLCVGETDARRSREHNVKVAAIFRSGDDEVCLSRESASGRLRGSIDGTSTSAEALRARAGELVVIHGQHDSLRLRAKSEALRLIDDYAHIDDSPLRHVRSDIRALEAQRDAYGGDEAARDREIDFLRFQISDIDRVAPTSPDELTETLEKLGEMVAIRDARDDIVASTTDMDGDGDDSVLQRLAAAIKRLPTTGIVGESRTRLESLAREMREIVTDVARRAEDVKFDEVTIANLEGRVGELQTLARKYGGSLASALDTRERLAKELTAAEASSDVLARVDVELAERSALEKVIASELRAARERSGGAFSSAVGGQFDRVALPAAQFVVSVGGDDGSQVEFLFSANPGSEPGPLHELASGGELARVLLAMSLETVTEGVVTVFDEVDAGIGGSVAQQIGECLKELSTRQQVIVVTHLASIAARADRHFVVHKTSDSSSTMTSVSEVRGDDRVSEIARMLAGESEMRESRALAKKLLAGS